VSESSFRYGVYMESLESRRIKGAAWLCAMGNLAAAEEDWTP
jgi:hypothetical protein